MAQAQQQKNTAKGKGGSSKAGAPTAFDLKSATLGLLSLVLKSPDTEALAAGLQAKLGDTPDMFDQDPLLIDLSQLDRAAPSAEPGQLNLDEAAATVDLAAVVALLRGHRMQPVAVAGANESERAQAQALGLALSSADDLTLARSEAAGAPEVREVEIIREVEVVREVAVPGEAVKALVIDKPLRSGQQVYAKGGDLIVMGLVNPGAEVIADGNIHVYAPLRGKAIAGARGNTDARIFAMSLEAELIAIAGTYRTTENPLPDSVFRKAAQIRLDGEKLVMEPI